MARRGGVQDDDAQWRFHQLWSAAQPAVAGYVRSLVADPHQADDLVQETALALFKRLDRYDESRPFVAWALTAAKNKVRDAWRARRRRGEVQLAESAIDTLADLGAELADDLDRERRALEVCLRGVEGRNQQLLELHYYRNQPAATIGERLGLKTGHVRVLLQRLRESLRACVLRRLGQGAS